MALPQRQVPGLFHRNASFRTDSDFSYKHQLKRVPKRSKSGDNSKSRKEKRVWNCQTLYDEHLIIIPDFIKTEQNALIGPASDTEWYRIGPLKVPWQNFA